MKTSIIFIIILFAITHKLNGQNRIIQGRVLSEDLEPLYKVRIQSIDTTLFGETDLDGRFKIEIPQKTQTLFLSWVGLERTNIKLKNYCDTLEIIMLYAGTYDFMSPKKIDRHRLERFKKLPELHLKAYDKGLFSKETICYSNEFEPHKPRFDEIQRQTIKKEVQIKQIFEKVNIGDPLTGARMWLSL